MWFAETGGAVPAFFACRLPTLRAVADTRDSPFTTIAWHHLCASQDVFRSYTGCRPGETTQISSLGRRVAGQKTTAAGQAPATSRERRESVRGAFATHPGSQVDNRRVLLVDDVKTTGATLDACAKALREAGRSAGLGLTVARAILDPQKVSRRNS
jgi:hypothetical protein